MKLQAKVDLLGGFWREIGVDLMESEEKGLVVHEVNNTTEYKNTVRVCEVDIPSLMLDYALNVEK